MEEEDAKKYGIDLSLLEINLSLSFEERLVRHQSALELVQEMEKARLVGFEKQGRIKVIKLTEEGNRVAEHIERIKNLL